VVFGKPLIVPRRRARIVIMQSGFVFHVAIILSNLSFDSFLIRSASRVARQKGNTSRLRAELGQQKGSNARPVLGDWLMWCTLTG
jgi:hypothetical protein